jgi:hypothetical protein
MFVRDDTSRGKSQAAIDFSGATELPVSMIAVTVGTLFERK